MGQDVHKADEEANIAFDFVTVQQTESSLTPGCFSFPSVTTSSLSWLRFSGILHCLVPSLRVVP